MNLTVNLTVNLSNVPNQEMAKKILRICPVMTLDQVSCLQFFLVSHDHLTMLPIVTDQFIVIAYEKYDDKCHIWALPVNANANLPVGTDISQGSEFPYEGTHVNGGSSNYDALFTLVEQYIKDHPECGFTLASC